MATVNLSDIDAVIGGIEVTLESQDVELQDSVSGYNLSGAYTISLHRITSGLTTRGEYVVTFGITPSESATQINVLRAVLTPTGAVFLRDCRNVNVSVIDVNQVIGKGVGLKPGVVHYINLASDVTDLLQTAIVSTTAPPIPNEGSLWWNPTTGELKIWDSGSWNPIVVSGSMPTIADGDLLANESGSSGFPVGVTLSSLLDYVIGTDRGAIVTRKSSAWQKLVPGTSGNILTSAGTGADIAWVAPAAQPIGIGTSFPGSPTSGEPFYRSDLGALFVYDGSVWQNSDSLAQLHDVSESGVADIDVLAYNNSASKWENTPLESSDSSITIARAGTKINLKAVGGGSGGSNVFPFLMRQQTAYSSGASSVLAASWAGGSTTGDFLLAIVTYSSFSGGTITTPSGWSIVLSISVSGGGLTWILYSKTSAGESGLTINKSRSDSGTLALLNFAGSRTVDKTATNATSTLIQGKPPALTSPATGAGVIVGVANDNANVNVMDFATPDSLCSWATSKQWGYSTLTSCFDSALIGYWQNKVGSASLFYPVSTWQGTGTLVSFSLSLT